MTIKKGNFQPNHDVIWVRLGSSHYKLQIDILYSSNRHL